MSDIPPKIVWKPTDKPYDIITLNKVTFNLADRVQRMEDAMINIVRLQLFLEESISVLEAKMDPPRESEIN